MYSWRWNYVEILNTIALNSFVDFWWCLNTKTHCSYLNIYISHKIRLFLLGKPISDHCTGQTYQFFYLKIQIYYSHFPLSFEELLFPVLFAHYWCFSKKVAIFEWNNCNSITSTVRNRNNSLQALDLTTPAKKEKKFGIIDLNF